MQPALGEQGASSIVFKAMTCQVRRCYDHQFNSKKRRPVSPGRRFDLVVHLPRFDMKPAMVRRDIYRVGDLYEFLLCIQFKHASGNLDGKKLSGFGPA